MPSRRVSDFELWFADVIAAGEAILLFAFVGGFLWAVSHPDQLHHLLNPNN